MFARRCIGSLAVLVFALLAAPTWAEPGKSGEGVLVSSFPDNADLRLKLFSRLLGAPRDIALAFEEEVLASPSGPVLVRVVDRAGDFLVEFRNGNGASFGDEARHTCVVQRSSAKGNYLVQARIYLLDDPSCYLRLYPQGSTTRGDVVMYGALVKKGLAIDGMLYQALVRPMSAIVESTRRAFDWGTVFAADDGGAAKAFASDLEAGASGDAAASVSRAAAIARRAADSPSAEAFLVAQSEAGETGAAELGDPTVLPAGLSSDRNEIGSATAFPAFPRYGAGKGIRADALRALLFLDIIASPGFAYVLLGDGIRAIAVPRFDAIGFSGIDLFAEGRAASWEDTLSGAKGSLVRVVRLPVAQR